MGENNFSKRFGHSSKEKEITIREAAPAGLRDFIIQSMYAYGYDAHFLRTHLCRTLRQNPDLNNWSASNVQQEVIILISECEWFKVYDFIEDLFAVISAENQLKFEEELNDYFKQSGIGWKIENRRVEMRGDEMFESTLVTASSALAGAGLQTAKSEIHEAIHDLSRRPNPDVTGAIQHSLACLECVCREAVGDKKATLGDLMKKAAGVVPAPLDQAISKIWGYSSEQGRHLAEGKDPDFLEAELLVGLSASISTYLAKKIKLSAKILIPSTESSSDDLPF